MNCPNCSTGRLEFVSGEFGSGVVHPDGTEETLHEEFFECDQCGHKTDEEEINEQIAEGYGPDPIIWPA